MYVHLLAETKSASIAREEDRKIIMLYLMAPYSLLWRYVQVKRVGVKQARSSSDGTIGWNNFYILTQDHHSVKFFPKGQDWYAL